MRVKCNLKAILDERDMSIRELSKQTGIGFESIRRLANDMSTQYQTKTVARVCEVLDIGLCELLELTPEEIKKD